jgi:hypothetical protein
MELLILKKKIDGFRSGNGQLQKVPAELLLELRHAWENYAGSMEQFRHELGMKVGTLRKLLIESKKLNHVLATAGAVGLSDPMSEVTQGNPEALSEGSASHLELVYDGGAKMIRFPSVDTLLEFLRKAA